ncbi:hypothetical protein Vafri_11919 [Volvox africanus]|uniref:Pherophorin domain-containing protein n=1 Tax=Volvox africanus TaxID=51714 RepID=A0A8J4F138_9CHLO|nr:hypothetical protein Vafri_11919 [Volvox africanus]
MVACGNFSWGLPAERFVNMTKMGDNTTGGIPGLQILAGRNYLNMSSGLRPDASGSPTCAPSVLTVSSYRLDNREMCDTGNYSTTCKAIPPTNFPYCACDRAEPSQTPYSMSYTRKYSQSGRNFYCFTIRADESECGKSKCCSMNLAKVEWLVNDQCSRSVFGFTLKPQGGRTISKSVSWSRYNDTSLKPAQTLAVLKTNNLGLSPSTANGVELCLALQANIPQCNTLTQLCYNGASSGCRFAMFEPSTRGCCAKSFVNGAFGAISSQRRFSNL